MIEDEIVAEVHRIREEHARQFNYDLDAIFKDFKRLEEEEKRRGVPFVRLPPKLLERHVAAQ